MASWALLPALSGFTCDVEQRTLRFKPALEPSSFGVLFTCAAGWGVYTRSLDDAGRVRRHVAVLGGDLKGFTLSDGDGVMTIG